MDANSRTEDIEQRSSSITSTLALGISLCISSLTLLPESTFLTAITTWTPRKARTRAVSVPIPLDAPEIRQRNKLKTYPINDKIPTDIDIYCHQKNKYDFEKLRYKSTVTILEVSAVFKSIEFINHRRDKFETGQTWL